MRYFIAGFLIALGGAGCERIPSTATDNPAEPSPALSSSEPAAVPLPLPTPAPPAPPLDHQPLVNQATELKKAGDLAGARDLLQPVADSGTEDDALLDLLGELNLQILLTPVPATEKIDYRVVSGDSLSKIAAEHRTTIELIKKSNHLASDLIRVDQRLRIFQGDFAVAVDKTRNTLILTHDGRFFKRYRVGTGQYSKTPVGQFKVTSRIDEPTWYRGDRDIPFGDPDNILGTHWLGLDIPGYGIHGTWDETAIGQQATAGCVRLRNAEIEELYTILPLGTPVTIHE